MSIRIDGTNTTANPGITGSDTDTGLQFGTNEVKVVTDGSDRVTVDSSGNVGIGTTANSDSQLHVKSGANDGNPVLRLEAATNNFLNFRQTGSVYDIRVTAGDPLSFTIGSSEKARVTSDGLTFNGDTAANNALDDYEVGTFTGRFNNQDDDATVSHGNQTGFYVKVGDLVHFSLYFDDIDVSSTGSTTFARIYGLPFNSLGTSQHYSVVNIIHNTIITSSAGAYVNTNTSFLIPTDVGTTTTSTFSTGTNFRLMIGGTYRAA
jgi:hypothetical protein